MLTKMPIAEFEEIAVEIAEEHVRACYISARYILEDGSLSCGFFSPVTHEVLASFSE